MITTLQLVEKGTKFSAAFFLNDESTIEIWNDLMRIWISMYIGFTDKVAVDQGPQLDPLY